VEIVAYGRSCAEAIFGSPGCHLFNTSHLGVSRGFLIHDRQVPLLLKFGPAAVTSLSTDQRTLAVARWVAIASFRWNVSHETMSRPCSPASE
jgi:hypothetical protein